MPYEVFIMALFASENRMLAWTGYQRGPWDATTVEGRRREEQARPTNPNPHPKPNPNPDPNPNPNPAPTRTPTHNQAFGKIQPRRSGPGHSATGIYPPSNWNPALLRRSRRPPEQQLELQHVYGYSGRSKY